MTITEKREQDALVIGLEGSLDTLTAPELEAFLDAAFGGRAGGTVYILADERPEEASCQGKDGAAGKRKQESCRAVILTPDDLRSVSEPADAGIFWMRETYSLEERAEFLYLLICSLRPGAQIRIPEEIYRCCSIGRIGMEVLLETFGVTLEVPEYGADRSIVGTVGVNDAAVS